MASFFVFDTHIQPPAIVYNNFVLPNDHEITRESPPTFTAAVSYYAGTPRVRASGERRALLPIPLLFYVYLSIEEPTTILRSAIITRLLRCYTI